MQINDTPRTCLRCGASLSGRGQTRYCSLDCYRRRNEGQTKACETCGTSFSPKGKQQRYCRASCRPKARRGCPVCGLSFVNAPSQNQVYCSRQCFARAREKWRNCDRCGKRYQPERDGGEQFCSAECRGAARRTPRPQCIACGKSFEPTRGRKQQCCGRACALKARYVQERQQGLHVHPEKICDSCGKRFTVFPYDVNRRFCSKDCAYEARRGVLPDHFRALAHSRTPTSIEVETYEALESLGVTFERQRFIGNALVDAYIRETRTVIEVQGDFFHCNPAVYPDGPRFQTQEDVVARDKRRFAYLRQRGYRVIELWEADIRKHGALTLLQKLL